MSTSFLPIKTLSKRFLDLLILEHSPSPADFSKEKCNPNVTLTESQYYELDDLCAIATDYFVNLSKHISPSSKNLSIALAACLTFLRQNGITINATELELFQIIMETDFEEASAHELKMFLIQHAECPKSLTQWVHQK